MITITTLKKGLFPLGQTVITPGTLDALAKAEQHSGNFLARHLSGDWGDLCEGDKAVNQEALTESLRLLSPSEGTKLDHH